MAAIYFISHSSSFQIITEERIYILNIYYIIKNNDFI